jgi:hypothetical protein
MRNTVISGLLGSVIIGLSSFLVGQATTNPAQEDGNPVGYHLAGDMVVKITPGFLASCAAAPCNLSFDFQFQTSQIANQTTCKKPNDCLHVSNSQGNATSVVDYADGWHLTRPDLYVDGAVSGP